MGGCACKKQRGADGSRRDELKSQDEGVKEAAIGGGQDLSPPLAKPPGAPVPAGAEPPAAMMMVPNHPPPLPLTYPPPPPLLQEKEISKTQEDSIVGPMVIAGPPQPRVLCNQLLPRTDPYFKKLALEQGVKAGNVAAAPANPNYASLADFQAAAVEPPPLPKAIDGSFESLAFFEVNDLAADEADPPPPVENAPQGPTDVAAPAAPPGNDFKVDPQMKMAQYMAPTEQNNKNYETLAFIDGDKALPKDADGPRMAPTKDASADLKAASLAPNFTQGISVLPKEADGVKKDACADLKATSLASNFTQGISVLPKEADGAKKDACADLKATSLAPNFTQGISVLPKEVDLKAASLAPNFTQGISVLPKEADLKAASLAPNFTQVISVLPKEADGVKKDASADLKATSLAPKLNHLPPGAYELKAPAPQPNPVGADFKVDARIKMGRHIAPTEQNNKNYATMAFIRSEALLPKDAVGAAPAKKDVSADLKATSLAPKLDHLPPAAVGAVPAKKDVSADLKATSLAPKLDHLPPAAYKAQAPQPIAAGAAFKVDARIKLGRHIAPTEQNNKNYATMAFIQDDVVLPKDAHGVAKAKDASADLKATSLAPKLDHLPPAAFDFKSPQANAVFKVDPRIKMGRHIAPTEQNNKNYATMACVQDFARDD